MTWWLELSSKMEEMYNFCNSNQPSVIIKYWGRGRWEENENKHKNKNKNRGEIDLF